MRIARSLALAASILMALNISSPALAQTELSEKASIRSILTAVVDHDSLVDTDFVGDAANVETDVDAVNAIEARVNGTDVVIPSSIVAPISVGDRDQILTIGRPELTAVETVELAPGAIAHTSNEGVTTISAVNSDGSVQIGTIIDNSSAPSRFDFELGLPHGGSIYELNGQIFVLDAAGELVGGFAPAWAKDANGLDVPTQYEVSGSTLTQFVDHDRPGVVYPVVADPAYARGMISQVKWERWRNGGWEVRLTVTALARWTQPINPGFVYSAGLADLREHHPSSMQYKTMAQQWDCHVAGLPGTINIDLESYRRSWDNWRAGIIPAILQGNPAKACNW
ncbi:MAG: hypothetical protein ACKVI4_12020 [Actinomycetales bacterium]|tara:strand:+ start:318 stop:1334 length:1017 start_codon:yes stop_codon:yes gene_type:complete